MSNESREKSRRAAALNVILATLFSLAFESPAQILTATKIAQRGEPAPGFDQQQPPLLFENFGLPLSFVEPEPVPGIDRQGNVTFIAFVGDDGIPNTGAAPLVYRWSSGTLQLVAQTGEPAPGTDSVFAGFPGPVTFPLEATPLISDGQLSIFASTTDVQFNTGVWSDRLTFGKSGALEFVVRQGDLLPAAPGTAIHSFALGFKGDHIIMNAAIHNGAKDGLWRNSNGTFDVIAIDGVPAPGVEPGVFFGEGTSLAFFGAVDGWDLNSLGQVVFNGYLMGTPTGCGNGLCEPLAGENCLSCPQDCNGQQTGNPDLRFCCGNGGGQNPVGCDDPRCTMASFECDSSPPMLHEENDEGIWADGPNGLQLIVRESEPALQAGLSHWFGSGGDGGFGGLETFGPESTITPRINDNGALLFGARVTSPQFYQKSSLWTTRTGELELLALAASPLGDPNFPGDPAPGLERFDATFSDFFQGDLSDDGVVAFQAATTFNNQPLVGTTGLWWDLPGKLSLIAALGEPVPGIDGAVFEQFIFPFIHSSGQWDWILFSASFTGSNQNNDLLPIFRATADGEVKLLLHPGIPVQLDSGEIKTLAFYRIGQGHADDGRYVAELTFTDGIHGVYVMDLIPPFNVLGDITGDGAVNVDDLLAVINQWGKCLPPSPLSCSADVAPPLSGDGDVNVDDLLLVINNWG